MRLELAQYGRSVDGRVSGGEGVQLVPLDVVVDLIQVPRLDEGIAVSTFPALRADHRFRSSRHGWVARGLANVAGAEDAAAGQQVHLPAAFPKNGSDVGRDGRVVCPVG